MDARLVRTRAILLLGTGLLALAVRLYGIGSVLTVDEPQWIFRSQSLYRALAHGDPGGTFQGTHPGVVPMLLIGGGIRAAELLWRTPLVSPAVGEFRTAAKVPVALGVSGGVALAALLVTSLWGARAGIAAGVLLALEPFFLGHAQLAHVDALLAVLMVLALLAWLVYERSRATRHLILSGFLGGLALLTKLPAISLLFFVGVLAITQGLPLRVAVRNMLRWSAVAVGVFLLLWPSMWLNLLPNLRYATRDVRAVAEVQETEPADGVTTTTFYLHALLRRMSPAALFLALGGIVLLPRVNPRLRRDGVVLTAAAIGFALALSVVGKRADRYLLPTVAILSVLASPALAALVTSGTRRRGTLFGRTLAAAVVAGMALTALLLKPYAITYVSPLALADEPSQSGWGEGLERAAALLNAHPLASELRVASWYPAVFREFFTGTTMSLSSRHDHRVTHVVLYRNMRGRHAASAATAALEEYQGRAATETISILGREVAWVYETDSVALFPTHVGELVAPSSSAAGVPMVVEAGQLLPISRDGWTGVRVAFSTFSSRPTSATVTVHIRESPDRPDLRTAVLEGDTIVDGEWRDIRFDPIPDSAGKTYYVAVTSPDGRPGNAVTLRYQPRDGFPGNAVILRRPLRAGEERLDFARDGDFALRALFGET